MSILKIITREQPGIIKRIRNYKNKGQFGEYLIDYAIKGRIKGYYKILTNIYIPTNNGTTEIDIILIHERGIFVIESKNYSGWIFGNKNDKYWTQCIKGGHKYKFYNPIKQNENHIKHLLEIVPINIKAIKSYIVFSNRCEFKTKIESTDEYKITNRNYLILNLYKEIEKSKVNIEHKAVDKIYNKLYIYTIINEEIKENHIRNIKKGSN